jgi:hypothetical protein
MELRNAASRFHCSDHRASSWIGAIYAERLGRRGHTLVLVACDKARVVALAARLGKETGVFTNVLPGMRQWSGSTAARRSHPVAAERNPMGDLQSRSPGHATQFTARASGGPLSNVTSYVTSKGDLSCTSRHP